MSLRLYLDPAATGPLLSGTELALPADAARHVQVRRLQPGDALRLFDGSGGEWAAQVLAMGRKDVQIQVGACTPGLAEPAHDWLLAVGMPANERMDALVEKATELGAAGIQPLVTERAVLRLDGERAVRRVAHWQGVAMASAEQSGRTRVPRIAPVQTLAAWLAALPAQAPAGEARQVLSTSEAPGLGPQVPGQAGVRHWTALSGPEGGLSPAEMAAAVARGFAPVSLGPRILRADTAPLAWLAQISLLTV